MVFPQRPLQPLASWAAPKCGRRSRMGATFLLAILLPSTCLGANPARMSSMWASRSHRRNPRTDPPAVRPARASTVLPPARPSPDPRQPNSEEEEQFPGEFSQLGFPLLLGVSLPGEAGKVQFQRAGVYTRTRLTRHHRPVWRQQLGSQWIFFSDYGNWVIGLDPKSNIGGLGSIKRGLDLVPKNGWQFYTKARKWQADSSIIVTGDHVFFHANF